MIKVHHPESGADWECSEKAFNLIWKDKGWVRAEDVKVEEAKVDTSEKSEKSESTRRVVTDSPQA